MWSQFPLHAALPFVGGTRAGAAATLRSAWGHPLQDWRITIVGNSNCQGASPSCLRQARYRERRGATCGNRNEHVINANVVLLNKSNGLINRVLGTFH